MSGDKTIVKYSRSRQLKFVQNAVVVCMKLLGDLLVGAVVFIILPHM